MGTPLSRRRRLAGLALAAGGMPLLTLIAYERGLALPDAILLFLLGVVALALVGGLWPALLAAVGAFLLLNYYFTPPLHTLAIATADNLLALTVFVVVAVAVSWVVDLAARRTRQADRAAGDARILAAVAGGVLRGDDPLQGLLRQLRDTFELDSVTLTECGRVVAAVGDPVATPAAGDVEVPADDTLRLVLRGRPPAAADLRIVRAFAAQAAVALRQQRLAAAAEGDRVRTALLAAVSHDLRTPLASAKAAVTSLRSPEVAFDAADRAELLATAEESLDRLIRLVANLLDMSRLQAGALGMTAADIGLEDVVPRALDELGPPGRTVVVHLPDELPAVRADPGLTEAMGGTLCPGATPGGGLTMILTLPAATTEVPA